ncbi:MAG TPA: ATP synthase F1 subunit delta [Bacteroidota bacterium]|nr:ATP synthase F1 subunit delta [Bacteroidota bacterium]
MSNFRAASRYATAVLAIAQELNKLDEVSKDFEYIERLIRDVREFSLFLKSPVIKTEKKKRLLSELFQGKLSDITFKFVTLLASKDREGILPDIIQQFYRLRDKRLGILNVKVRTAVQFLSGQEEQLMGQLERVLKKKIRVNYVKDSSLKGGFTVQYDDTVWDASVNHQLDMLRQKLVESM